MEELICREGTVHSVIFQNAENGYTVLRLLTEEGEVVTVVGCIPCVAPGEHLTVTGTWEVHPQHGEQLKAQELERTLPEERGDLRLPVLRRLQGRGTHHRPADRGPVRLGDPGYFRGGAGAASGDPGHYREKGHGDRRAVPSAHGLAAADGISLPVSAAAGAGHPAAAAVWGRGHPGGGEKSLICCQTMYAAWIFP